MKYVMIMLVFMMSLAACSNDDSAERLVEKKKVANKQTVFDSHLDALEKAKNVENILQQSVDKRKREMDNQ